MSERITYFAATDFRNERKRFGIRQKDRLRHVYIIGKTGVGKSTLLENMAVQDIQSGHGMAFLDPHGKTAELLLDYVPPERVDDVVYFAPFDLEYPISFNVLEDVDPDKRHHVANGILSVMKKIWVDAFSGRMEYILQNTLLALLEYPEATLLGINRVLTDKEYRKKVILNISDPTVRAFWVDEYEKWDDRYQRDAGASIQNKVGQFTSNPLIRNIVGQPQSRFDIRKMMDDGKILIANLSKGLLGEQNARLLGGMLSTSIYLAGMSRAELSEHEMDAAKPFYLYVDEFQNFANDSFADVLSEARKYKLSLTVAHQYLDQLPDTVLDAVLGNVGTMISFRVGPKDGEVFEREFAPVFTKEDFTNLGFAQIYLRLMIGATASKPFSARTIPPIPKPEVSMYDAVRIRSRQLYAQPRAAVEDYITEWYRPIPTKESIEHQSYLSEKRREVEANGGIWVDFNEYPKLKGLGPVEAEKRMHGILKAEDRLTQLQDLSFRNKYEDLSPEDFALFKRLKQEARKEFSASKKDLSSDERGSGSDSGGKKFTADRSAKKNSYQKNNREFSRNDSSGRNPNARFQKKSRDVQEDFPVNKIEKAAVENEVSDSLAALVDSLEVKDTVASKKNIQKQAFEEKKVFKAKKPKRTPVVHKKTADISVEKNSAQKIKKPNNTVVVKKFSETNKQKPSIERGASASNKSALRDILKQTGVLEKVTEHKDSVQKETGDAKPQNENVEPANATKVAKLNENSYTKPAFQVAKPAKQVSPDVLRAVFDDVEKRMNSQNQNNSPGE